MSADTDTATLPRWFDIPPVGQTWEYGANALPEHAVHMPRFIEPPAQPVEVEFDCE